MQSPRRAMLRVTGGDLRGRRFHAPKGRYTRPTSEKVRESIFSALAHYSPIEGAAVLDLFAGSGALGIEALSRGAAHAHFVESHAPTAALLRTNLELLGVDTARWQVVRGKVETWLPGWLSKAALGQGPLIVLLDPPYASHAAARTLKNLAGSEHLPRQTMIMVETTTRLTLEPPAGLELLRTRRYGDTQVLFFSYTGAPSPAQRQGPTQ